VGATTEGQGTEIMVDSLQMDNSLFTRKEDPFQPAMVAEILRQVRIGDDLMAAQQESVEQLITEWADIFALLVSKVFPVDGAVHMLNILVDAMFLKKVHQKPLTPPQRQYLHTKINEMLAAGVIEQCKPGQVKCVSPTTLAQKVHKGGLTLEELQHRISDQCITNSFKPHFQMPPQTEPMPSDEVGSKPKWRICQNFAEVKKLQRSPQCHRETYEPSSINLAAIVGCPFSISWQVFMPLKLQKLLGLTLHSMSNNVVTFGMPICHLDSWECHLPSHT